MKDSRDSLEQTDKAAIHNLEGGGQLTLDYNSCSTNVAYTHYYHSLPTSDQTTVAIFCMEQYQGILERQLCWILYSAAIN